MKIDVHSHLMTSRGYPQHPRVLGSMSRYYGHGFEHKSEAEIAEIHKKAGVKSIIAITSSLTTLEQIKNWHDYTSDVVKQYADSFLGAWACVAVTEGRKGLRELERCLTQLGMLGASFAHLLSGQPIAYDDEVCYPFYELCAEAGVPALLYVGMTGAGAGTPGGGGLTMERFRPVPYVDNVAARYPGLTIIASHPAWPWDAEMIMILLHKANVFQDLHGWSPKYFSPELKREINGRLQDRFFYGNDYPLISFERCQGDWQSGEFKPEVLEKIFYKNAQRVFKLD